MKKTLEEIAREKESLRGKIRELEKMERFRQACSKFNYSKPLGEAVATLINHNEEKPYTCCTITKTFPGKGHYEPTGYYDDDPSGCGGGWVSTGERFVTDPDTTLEYIVIMEQDVYDLFMKLKFTSVEDFINNLKVLASQGKQLVFDKDTFNPEAIAKKFPYVGEFFRQLAEERYEAGKLNIDINNCLNSMLGQAPKYTRPTTKPNKGNKGNKGNK